MVCLTLCVWGCGGKEKQAEVLFEAVAGNDLSKVRSGLKANPEWINAKDNIGFTPLHMAVTMGHREMAELLLVQGADVDARDTFGQTSLHQAARWGHKDLAEFLIAKGADVNAKDEAGGTVLHHAAIQGDESVVELLIARGADVNARNNKNRTPLDLAKEAYPRVAEVLARHAAKQ